jgi:hypothetical protein
MYAQTHTHLHRALHNRMRKFLKFYENWKQDMRSLKEISYPVLFMLSIFPCHFFIFFIHTLWKLFNSLSSRLKFLSDVRKSHWCLGDLKTNAVFFFFRFLCTLCSSGLKWNHYFLQHSQWSLHSSKSFTPTPRNASWPAYATSEFKILHLTHCVNMLWM